MIDSFQGGPDAPDADDDPDREGDAGAVGHRDDALGPLLPHLLQHHPTHELRRIRNLVPLTSN